MLSHLGSKEELSRSSPNTYEETKQISSDGIYFERKLCFWQWTNSLPQENTKQLTLEGKLLQNVTQPSINGKMVLPPAPKVMALFFQGPKGENVGSITQPLPSSYLIFRAASESDGKITIAYDKFMKLHCSQVQVNNEVPIKWICRKVTTSKSA